MSDHSLAPCRRCGTNLSPNAITCPACQCSRPLYPCKICLNKPSKDEIQLSVGDWTRVPFHERCIRELFPAVAACHRCGGQIVLTVNERAARSLVSDERFLSPRQLQPDCAYCGDPNALDAKDSCPFCDLPIWGSHVVLEADWPNRSISGGGPTTKRFHTPCVIARRQSEHGRDREKHDLYSWHDLRPSAAVAQGWGCATLSLSLSLMIGAITMCYFMAI